MKTLTLDKAVEQAMQLIIQRNFISFLRTIYLRQTDTTRLSNWIKTEDIRIENNRKVTSDISSTRGLLFLELTNRGLLNNNHSHIYARLLLIFIELLIGTYIIINLAYIGFHYSIIAIFGVLISHYLVYNYLYK